MIYKILIFLLCVASFVLPIKAQVEAINSQNPSFGITSDQASEPVSEITITPGKVVKISLNGSNLAAIGGLNIQLTLPWEQVSILEMKQSSDICQVWDKAPEFHNGVIEFICIQGLEPKSSGKILDLTLLATGNLTNGEINIADYNFIDLQGKLFKGNPQKVLIIKNSQIDTTLTSGEFNDKTNTKTNGINFNNLTLIITIFLGAAIIITLFLAYRLIRLSK